MEILLSFGAFIGFFGLLFFAVTVDIRSRKIPNWVIFSTVILWTVWQFALLLIGVSSDALHAFAGALALYMALAAFTFVAEKVSGRYLFGGGDIKLVAASSLFLGLEGALVALFAACMVSLFYAAARLPNGIPFAPCMFCGSLLALLA